VAFPFEGSPPMRFRHFALLAVVCIPFLFLIPKGAHAVWRDNLILSSAVEGQLLNQGRPMAGVKVKRILLWNMETEARTEITTTKADGKFQFPEVRGAAEFGFLAKLFHVPVVSQEIFLMQPNEEIILYSKTRSSYDPKFETGYDEIQFTCDLASRELINGVLPSLNCKVRKLKHGGAE
jgi:hypothetical protein